jgi:Gas vesicle synthesis protein GvpL/GvpF
VNTRAGVIGRHQAGNDSGSSADQATWLYAITNNLGEAALTGLRGVAGGQIRALHSGTLTAVVESVDPRKFSADRLQDQLSDPAELEAIARRHHDVVVAVAALSAALPLRLATVYLTDNRVLRLLSQRRDEFCQTLGWLEHRTECGIKAWADPDGFTRDLAQQSTSGTDSRPTGAQSPETGNKSGAAYLMRRRAELAERAAGQRLAAQCGELIHAALDRMAIASRLHPLHDMTAAADAGLQVLNAAYLVESASSAEFAESARAVGAQAGATRVVVTGPWPTYSFADGPNDLRCQRSLPGKWSPGRPLRT